MALVTVQRSPTPSNSVEEDQKAEVFSNDAIVADSASQCHCDSQRSTKSLTKQKSLTSECYFAVKGAAVILPQNDCVMIPRQASSTGGEIQLHLQAMLHLLRAQDTLKMAVRLESIFNQHTRYMAIVSTTGRQDNHESILLGIDYVTPEETSIGLVVPIWASSLITLDGDGGISVESTGSQFVFKPVSVQAMWSAFQCLHKEHDTACSPYPYFPGGLTHTWTQYYEARLLSKEAFRSEWHYVYCPDDSEDLKADNMQRFKEKPPEKAAKEKMIRLTLKDIMQSVDLDEVTSKDIRQKLEEKMNTNLHHYKEFIDREMLIILGQMDKPSQIFPYLYLGTEWNASNWDELKQNNVGYILNVTKEVDNFFPGMFFYMKIRVSDEESTELLKHWDLTFKFIARAKQNNTAVLVHCKKGISRSSSTVIAYAMKSYGWSLTEALNYVKDKRNCITPNKGFMEQLKTYQGILEASQNRKSYLFNKQQAGPLSPDLVPWDGLSDFDEALMETEDRKCIFTTLNENLCSAEVPLFDTPQKQRLLFASENIVKSAPSEDGKLSNLDSEPPPSIANCTVTADQFNPDVKFHLDDTNFDENSVVVPPLLLNFECQKDDIDEDALPDLNSRPSMRRRLRNVEHKASSNSLRNIQELLTRKSSSSLTPSSSAVDTSSNGSSSLTGGSSGEDEEPEIHAPLQRRGSKGSSGGDSAVADLLQANASTNLQKNNDSDQGDVTLRRSCYTESELNKQMVVLSKRPISCAGGIVPTGQVKRYTQVYERSCSGSKSDTPKVSPPTILSSALGCLIPAVTVSNEKRSGAAPKKLWDKIFTRRDSGGESKSSHSAVGKTPAFHSKTKWYQEVGKRAEKSLANNCRSVDSSVDTNSAKFNNGNFRCCMTPAICATDSQHGAPRTRRSYNTARDCPYDDQNNTRKTFRSNYKSPNKMVRSLVNIFEQTEKTYSTANFEPKKLKKPFRVEVNKEQSSLIKRVGSMCTFPLNESNNRNNTVACAIRPLFLCSRSKSLSRYSSGSDSK